MHDPTSKPARGPGFEVTGSRHFLEWLDGLGASLAATTYHSNRLFLLGVKDDGRLSIFQRVFERAMGLAASSERLLLATRFQLWQLDNLLRPGEKEGTYDRFYKPHLAWTTGDIDMHDIAFGRGGEPIFVNTLFGCLATVDERHSFKPLWRPPWLSKLAPEDRCHLNGVAMSDGEPRFVTAIARTDVAAGWREHRHDGGVVVDVPSSEIVASGLSMPHSPRLHRGELWLLNSGTGELGVVDLNDGHFEPVCFCPGYLRGLAFLRRLRRRRHVEVPGGAHFLRPRARRAAPAEGRGGAQRAGGDRARDRQPGALAGAGWRDARALRRAGPAGSALPDGSWA